MQANDNMVHWAAATQECSDQTHYNAAGLNPGNTSFMTNGRAYSNCMEELTLLTNGPSVGLTTLGNGLRL